MSMITSDNSGSGSGNNSVTTKDTYTWPGNMSRSKAEAWCNDNERYGELGGGRHISTTCILSGK